MAGLCLLNVRELKLLEIFFFPRPEILPLHRCQPGKLAVDPGRIRVLHVPDVWHFFAQSNLEDARCEIEIVVTSPVAIPGNPNSLIETTQMTPLLATLHSKTLCYL